MTKQLDFYFDVASPASYLAWTQLTGLQNRTGCTIRMKPIYAWGLFKQAGTTSPVQSPSKIRWFARDMKRWGDRHGVPINLNPHFPFASLTMMRGLIAYREMPEFDALVAAFFNAMWVNPRKMDEETEISAVVESVGLDGATFLARTGDPGVKEGLQSETGAAAKAGVFGVPSFIIDGKLDWGQDRLDFVEQALTA